MVNYDNEIIVENCDEGDLDPVSIKVPSEFKTSRVSDRSPLISARQSVRQSDVLNDELFSNNHSQIIDPTIHVSYISGGENSVIGSQIENERSFVASN